MTPGKDGGSTSRSPTIFPHLFRPLAIRSVELRNRIVLLPMGTRLVRDGRPTEDAVAFYRARAEGGVGLVITGGTDAHETTAYRGRRAVEAYDAEVVPALARVAAGVHEGGARIFGQIAHLGREYNRDMDESEWPALAPSAIPGASALSPHVLTMPEIDVLVEGYARSAANFIAAGYDGVEIQANHGYLAAQFLGERTNHRTDGYGGSVERRRRFLFELIRAVRDRIGDEPPVGVRLSLDEEVSGGLGVADAALTAVAIETLGEVDYVSLSVGLAGGYVKDMSAPNGVAVTRAQEFKQSVRLPVIVSQRITTPELAESILANGAADLIGMARALIADPAWARKAREDLTAEIAPCVGAVQGCHTFPIGCVHNPEAGREVAWRPGALPPVHRARRVVVVGGGPGGLETARVAAERGHRVTLFERASELGGQVTIAAHAPGRAGLAGIVAYRARELKRLGVDVQTGTVATVDSVVGLGPDVVVVASGSVRRAPSILGADGPSVRSPWDILGSGPAALEPPPGMSSPAVVIDDGSGFWEVCSSAEALAERGWRVAIVTPGLHVATGVPKDSLRGLLGRLRSAGVEFHPMARAVSIDDDGVHVVDTVVEPALAAATKRVLRARLVVAYAGKDVDDALVAALAGRIPEVHAVGDCVAPRRIREAIYEGYAIGRVL